MTSKVSLLALKIAIDTAVALALTLFMSMTLGLALEAGGEGISKAWFFYWMFFITPFRIFSEFWVIVPLNFCFLAMFIGAIKVRSRTRRFLALVIWLLSWQFYGAMCLSIYSAG